MVLLGKSLIDARSIRFKQLISTFRDDPLNVDLLICNFGLPEFARYFNLHIFRTRAIYQLY